MQCHGYQNMMAGWQSVKQTAQLLCLITQNAPKKVRFSTLLSCSCNCVWTSFSASDSNRTSTPLRWNRYPSQHLSQFHVNISETGASKQDTTFEVGHSLCMIFWRVLLQVWPFKAPNTVDSYNSPSAVMEWPSESSLFIPRSKANPMLWLYLANSATAKNRMILFSTAKLEMTMSV